MINACTEILEHLEYSKVFLKAANIVIGSEYSSNRKICKLRVGHTPDEFKSFLKCLNVEYDDGYGRQELFGIVWHTDGTWSERGEYDGSEWWEHRRLPEIPEDLRGA